MVTADAPVDGYNLGISLTDVFPAGILRLNAKEVCPAIGNPYSPVSRREHRHRDKAFIASPANAGR
jgi:hypothetical protein